MRGQNLLVLFSLSWLRPTISFPTIQFSSQTVFGTGTGTTTGPATPPPAQILDAETDKFINNLLKEWNSAGGISVAVVQLQPDGTWHTETKGYGVANVKGEPVDSDTLFAIGSNSKLFNVLATGLLITNSTTPSPQNQNQTQTQITWDTKLIDVIPDWKLMDPIASAETTITDAMSHRTGLPRHDTMYRTTDSVTDIVKRLQYLKPSAPFRSIWQYNNMMYSVLSLLPSLIIPGTKFEDYVKENIFDKLGFGSTTYEYAFAEKTGRLANGFGREGMNLTRSLFDKGIPRAMEYWNQGDSSLIAGAGGIIMSANDVAIWLKTLLLGGHNPETLEPVIPPEVIQKALWGFTVAVPVGPYPELSPEVYGGGQTQFSYRGQLIIEHGGGTPGFLTQISRLPYSNFGLAVFSNDDVFGSLLNEIVKYHIIDTKVLLAPSGSGLVPPIDWNTRFKTLLKTQYDTAKERIVPPPPLEDTHPPLKPFHSLQGVYNNPGYGDYELCYLPAIPSTPPGSPPSLSCKNLLRSLSSVLPGVFNFTNTNTNTTTKTNKLGRRNLFVAAVPQIWVSHIVLEHFDGNLFNLSAYQSRRVITEDDGDCDGEGEGDDEQVRDRYWAAPLQVVGLTAEFGFGDSEKNEKKKKKLGFALKGGIWGASPFVPPLKGDSSLEEEAEVWFERVYPL